MTVGQLKKKAFLNRKPNNLKDIDADQLTFWKVHYF